MPSRTPGAIPLRERRTLAEEWAEFEQKVLSTDAPLVQRHEMRKAFYAGALCLNNLLLQNLDASDDPSQLDLDYYDLLTKEIEAFYVSLGL